MKKPPKHPKPEPRQPAIMIATGQTGVGKTWRSRRDLQEYFEKGRKVLIFDTNQEGEYKKIKTLWFDVNAEDELMAVREVLKFSNQKTAEIRRIAPVCVDGRGMERDEKAKAALLIMKHFHGGLLVLEDYNAYFSTSRSGAFISSITTNRHRRQDIWIHVQTLRKVDSSLNENITWLRLHKQVDPVETYAERFPNQQLVTVATAVVDDQYLAGNKRYFCYVNVRENKLVGVTEADFVQACRRYLQTKPATINGMLTWEDENGKLLYPTRLDATLAWINQKKAEWLA